MLYLEDDDEDQGQLAELSHLGYKAPHLPSSGTALCPTSDIMKG